MFYRRTQERSYARAHAFAALFLFALAGGALHAQPQTKGLALSPNSLVFPVTVKGKPSTAQTVTVTSVGNTAVTFTGFTISGTNAADFAITANTCGATLASGVSCQISVTFTPSAAGSRTASLNLADDATGSPQSVALSGTSSTIVFTLRPGAITFPVITVGSSSGAVTVTVTNIGIASATISSIAIGGANPTDFPIGSKTCGTTLAASASCTVNVSFTPKANGIRTATLLLTDTAAGSPQAVPLTGTAQSATQNLIFSPTSLVLGSVNLGALAVSPVSVTNYGTNPVTFTSASISGANPSDFAIASSNCSVLASTSSCAIYIAFRPAASGLRSAILVVQDNAPGSPQSVPLFGTGVPPAPILSFSPSAVNFAPQGVGSSTSASLTVTNYGSMGASFSSFALTGTNAADFFLSANSCPTGTTLLTPSTSCYISISFTPSAAGVRTASLVITDNATGSPQIVSLSGTGQSLLKQLSFTSGVLSFGAETVGYTTGLNSVTVRNVGAASVTLSKVTLAGAAAADFTVNDANCVPGLVLTPNSSCYVDLKFTPSTTGSRAASLTFTDDAQGSPQTVTLVGFGQSATQQLSFSYVNLDLGIQDVGTTSSQTGINVANLGEAPVNFTAITVTGANASDFNVTSNGCLSPNSLAPGSTCTVYASFTPSASGVRTAQLVFTDSATGSPQSVGLSGTGQNVIQTVTFNYPSLVFPAQVVATTSSQQIEYFNNTGNAPVTISAVTITGGNAADFAISSSQCQAGEQINPNGYCYVYVNFTPSATGLRTSTLQFTDTATGSPHTVPLVGVGAPATSLLSFNPTDLGFNDQNVSTTSASQTINVSNPGSAAVSETFSITGANAGDFSILTNSCPASLGSGAGCSLSITFHPSGLGSRFATVQIKANTTTLFVGLSGIGTASSKVITTQQSAIDFGPWNVSASSNQMVATLLNTGTATVSFASFSIGGSNPGDFAITNNQCGSSLTVGASCNIFVTFTPTATGVRTGTLQVADDATGSPQAIPLSGIGQTPTKTLDVPPVLAFAAINVGSSQSQYFYVYNTGTAPITLTSTTITGTNASDFASGQTNCPAGSTIPPNGNCYFYVSFTPTAPGVRAAAFQLTDDATGSPQSVQLNGFGQAATKTIVLPQSLGLPLTTVGLTNASVYFYIVNTGNAAVTITSQTIAGANASDFAVSQTTCGNPIPAGSNCYDYISFTPSAAGIRTATLSVADDATGSPQTVALSGVGQAATHSLSIPPALTFPATTLGVTLQSPPVYVYNVGTADITLTTIAITGTNASEFAISGTNCSSGTTLSAGNYCYFYITFTPTALGVQTAALQFTDNAVGSPQSIALNGIGQGVTNTLTPAPASLAFGPLPVGSGSSPLLTYLYNTGTGTITLSNVAIAGANPGDFSIYSGSCAVGTQITPGSYCYTYVQFTPTATGARTASLQYSDNAVGGTQTVSLTGVGQ